MPKNKLYYLIGLLAGGLGGVKSAYAGLLDSSLSDKLKRDTSELAGKAFNTNPDPGYFISELIKAFIGLLGVIFIILIIYAGYSWMTAGGEEEKVRKAKDTIKRAVIGLIIIAAAYAITAFIFKSLPAGSGTGSITGHE